MKSERRHDLKTNSLAKSVENVPAFLQQNGSRILLVAVLCLLAYILVYKHINGNAETARQAGNALGTALYAIEKVRTPPLSTPETVAGWRQEYSREAEESIADALRLTSDPLVKAQALVARGDLNWQLANYPRLPETRPEPKAPRSSNELLKIAEESYSQVLTPPLDRDESSVIAARLGLASIAENQGQWDKARQHYQQVVSDAAAGEEFKKLARERLESLSRLEKPVLLGAFPSTAATTAAMEPQSQAFYVTADARRGSATAPSTGPASQPTSAPAAPPATASAPTSAPVMTAPSAGK